MMPNFGEFITTAMPASFKRNQKLDPSPSGVVEQTEEQVTENLELVDGLRALREEESQRLLAITDELRAITKEGRNNYEQ